MIKIIFKRILFFSLCAIFSTVLSAQEITGSWHGIGGNEKAIVKELEGLNHLFQFCKTGSPNEYATIEETFSIDALKLITEWLKKQ